MLTFPEGHTISQTVPIAMYLGKALGLAPTTDAEGAKALQVVMDGLDMNTESGQDKPAERINKWEAQMGGLRARRQARSLGGADGRTPSDRRVEQDSASSRQFHLDAYGCAVESNPAHSSTTNINK